MKRVLILLAAFLGLTFLQASTETRQAHSVARLVSEEKTLGLGQPVALGLHLSLDEGWHSYWENPGDSGTPPLFKWTLPEGFKVQGPFYTVPERIEVNHLNSFGYKTEAFYRFEIENSLSEVPSRPVSLVLDAEWLVCEKTCIPAKHRFTLELPVAKASEPSPDAPLIARFFNQLPEDAEKLQVEVESKPESERVEVTSSKPLEVLDVFPSFHWAVSQKKPLIERQNEKTRLIFEKKGESPELSSLGLLVFRGPSEGQKVRALNLVKTEKKVLSGFFGAFLFAFLGGLLLNLMPCVFPVLSIKVFSVLEQAGKGSSWVRHSSLVYAAGILVSFTLLGLMLAALRSWGEAVGWGFQLQNPYLLTLLIFLFLSLGASFLGAIDLSWLQAGAGQSLTNQAGWTGEFFSGVLCVIVASPCTAPFMGAALGYAISQPLPILIVVFLAMGIGLCFPYLMLACFPKAAKVLPRPGQWMELVKEVMAFPLFATVLWLLWILGKAVNPSAVIGVLAGILLSSVGLWLFHLKRKKKGKLHRWAGMGMGWLGLVFSLMFIRTQLLEGSPNPSELSGHGISWEAFSEDKAKEYSLKGKAVFVDFTASWCVTCQVNEEVTFGNASVREFIKEKEIIMMKADWTKADPAITQALKSYDRIGVPFYVVYAPSSGKGKGLGEILTPKIFKNAFN